MKKSNVSTEHEIEATAGGALAGAAIGLVAGPPGAIAGAVIGAVAGAMAGVAIGEGDDEHDEEERALDEEIGVNGATLGAPNLKHPPAKVGAYSAGSAGAGAAIDESDAAEGPMQSPDSK